MDNGPHIFGKKNSFDPNTIFKFVATTLEISDIRVTFRNFAKGASRLQAVENAMIGLAQDLGISIEDWKKATQEVLAARAKQAKAKKPSIVKDQKETELEEAEKDETPGEDTSEELSD